MTEPTPTTAAESPTDAVATLRDLAANLRAAYARPLTRLERVALAILVLVPVVFNAVTLLSELTIPVPSVNDDMLHYLFVQSASDALATGQSIFDHWLPQIETGVAQFFYYQHVPALLVVAIERLSLGNLELLTSLNLVRYVLMVGFPLTVFVSMRLLGFSGVAAAIAAAASSLLAGDFRYGFEYDSYTWRGFGMFTQLCAMHLSFLAVAFAYRAIHLGRQLWLAAIALGLLVLTHLIYAYIAGVAILVIALWGISSVNVKARAVRLGIVGLAAAVLSSYMWLPFLSQIAYLNATPYLQQYKYDSFGAGAISAWLVTGDLWDHGRLPVLTILFGLGVVGAFVLRLRVAKLALGIFVVILVIYFGRPTLGPLVNLLPLHDGLLLHRFIGGVDLAAIVLMGVGGALLWLLLGRIGRMAGPLVAVAAVGLLLVPALAERASFYSDNTAFQQRSMAALDADADAKTILAKLADLPTGRVYAGLPSNWGNSMTFADLRFYNLFPFYGIESLAPPTESLSLNSDFIWDFNERDAGSFDLFNVRYMVAPTQLVVGRFLTPLVKTARYTLYEAPTRGYGEYVSLVNRVAVSTQADLFRLNRAWVRSGTLPDQRLYTRYDYPATTLAGPSIAPGSGASSQCLAQGQTTLSGLLPGRIVAEASCPADGTFVLKTTFHPNWKVTVDGVPVPTFMVSPSYIGISLPPGQHAIDAQYVATPIKTPLLLLGWFLLLGLVLANRRVDLLAAAVVARLRLPRGQGSGLGAPRPLAPEATYAAALRGRWAGFRAELARAAPVPLLAAAGACLFILLFLLQHAIYADGSVTGPRPGDGSAVTLELVTYALVTAGLFAVMGAFVVLARRGRLVGLGRRIALGVPVAIMAAYLVDRPALSLDVLSYAAHGAIAAAGQNPYTDLPSVVAGTAVGQQLTALGWLPPPLATPYGPLWTLIEATVMQLTSSVPSAVFVFKLIAFVATLGAARLVWLILGGVRPSDQLVGTILILWNPLIIAELVGEGHNDALMAFFALIGLRATVRIWPTRAVVGTALGGLIKYVPLVLLPAQVVFLWRNRTSTGTFVGGLVAGSVVAAVLFAIGFAPFWAGTDTFAGLARVGQAGPWPTIPGALYAVLSRTGWFGDPGLAVTVVMSAVFVVALAWLSWGVRDARGLLSAVARIALLYALLVSPLWYPWYVAFAVILLALTPDGWSIGLIFLLSILARLVAPLIDLRAEFLPIADGARVSTILVVAVSLTAFGLIEVYRWWAGTSTDARPATPPAVPSPET